MELKAFLWSLIVIYVAARLLGELTARLGQSSVLGELLAGVLVGGSVLGWVEETETLKLLGEIGVMLLLFEVGLESDLQAFWKVGPSALAVATIGVVTPFALGGGLALLLNLTPLQMIFIGATLTATSVAITSRVLADLGKLKTPEGHIILGAAVLDDIIGLVLLSVIVGLAQSGEVSWLDVGRTAGLAILFLGGAILLGTRYAHLFGGLVNRMKTRGRLIVATVTFALLLGYVSELLHIAPLIGAFAAGLVLARTEQQAHIKETVKPVADVFVPIFFVLIGAAVELRHLNPFDQQNWPVLLLAGGLTIAAVLGKLASGFGVRDRQVSRWVVGVGMLPRGEVGLIFAGMGLSHGVITKGPYGALMVMVVLTTLIAPIWLTRLFAKK